MRMDDSLPTIQSLVGLEQQLVLDRWCCLGEYDFDLQSRWIAVMHQMDFTYKQNTPASLCDWICRRHEMGARAYYYASSSYEIAIRFDYAASRQAFRIFSVGFVGQIAPQPALDMAIDIALQFLEDSRSFELRVPARTDLMVAVHPKRMDSPAILEFYRLIRTSPRLRTTIEAESDRAVCLCIEPA